MFTKNVLLFDHQENLIGTVNVRRYLEEYVKVVSC